MGAVDSEETGNTKPTKSYWRWPNYQEVGVPKSGELSAGGSAGNSGTSRGTACTRKKPTRTGPWNKPDTATVPQSMNVQKQSIVVHGRWMGCLLRC